VEPSKRCLTQSNETAELIKDPMECSVPTSWKRISEMDLEDLKESFPAKLEGKVEPLYELGDGAYGAVYAAKYRCAAGAKTATWTALKYSRAKSERVGLRKVWTSTGKREVAVMKAFNAVSTYGVKLVDEASVGPAGREDQFMVMEACSNGDLQGMLEKGLDIRMGAALYLDAMTGVRDMHSNKLVHADIKPANILLTKELRAKFVDFGISCQEDSSSQEVACTNSNGTPAFMAPEYYDSDREEDYTIDKKADMWAMGLILYQIINGPGKPEAIFGANSFDMEESLASWNVESDPAVEKIKKPTVVTLLKGLLQKDPSRRMNVDEALKKSATVGN